MKHGRLLPALAVFAYLLVCPAPLPAQQARSRAEREVLAVIDAVVDAGIKKDLAAIDGLYADDYIHTNADGSTMTKAQMLAFYKTPSSGSIASSGHDEDRVQVHGGAAVVNTRITVKGSADDRPYSRLFRVTYVLGRERGRWRVIASHASVIMAASAGAKRIPVEIPVTNQIYIRARINDSEPMWFILDTGATWTILDADKARELGIKSEAPRTLDLGQANRVTTTFARDAVLDISGVKVPVPTLAVMPTKLRHAPQVVGLIGSDLFKRFVVEIDYQAKAVTLFEPQTYRYAGHGDVIPVEFFEEIPRLVVQIFKGDAGAVSAIVDLDTGASQTVVLNAPFVEENGLLKTTEGTVKIATGGLGGGNYVRKVRAKSVKVGNTVFDGPLIDFSENTTAAERRNGEIGNGLLNRFKVILDYSRRQVILEPTERINVPTDFDFFQFDLVKDGDGFKVGDVFRPAIAGAAGLKAGDRLLAVDDKPVADMSLVEVTRMFMWDGRDILMTVKRGDETAKIKLETFPIF